MKEKENEIRIPNMPNEKSMRFSEKKKVALESICIPGGGQQTYDLEQTLSSQQRKFLNDAKSASQSELSSDKELLAGAIAGDATSQAYVEAQKRSEEARENEEKRRNARFAKNMQKNMAKIFRKPAEVPDDAEPDKQQKFVRKTRNAELER